MYIIHECMYILYMIACIYYTRPAGKVLKSFKFRVSGDLFSGVMPVSTERLFRRDLFNRKILLSRFNEQKENFVNIFSAEIL